MRKRTYMTMVTGLALGALAISTVAAAHGPLRQRQYRQGARIYQGVRDSSITRAERKALVKEQRHINRMRTRALADGKMTRHEARRIARAQDRHRRHVYRARHNDRYRDTEDWRYEGRRHSYRYWEDYNPSYWARHGRWW